MSKVHVAFIQDRSGSMSTVWDETLSGYREFLGGLQEADGKEDVRYTFSLTTFDTLVETPIPPMPVAGLALDELAKHGPRGSTALYDAVGNTIRKVEEDAKDADKVIVVVVTDGHENSSREWTKDALHSAVDAKLRAGSWTFTYLGTQPETWDEAEAIGVRRGSTATYDAARVNFAYAATCKAVKRFASSSEPASPNLIADYLSEQEVEDGGMKAAPEGPQSKEDVGEKWGDKLRGTFMRKRKLSPKKPSDSAGR